MFLAHTLDTKSYVVHTKKTKIKKRNMYHTKINRILTINALIISIQVFFLLLFSFYAYRSFDSKILCDLYIHAMKLFF
jgi:hypothetical protein